MPMFDVYVDGPVSSGPAGVKALAQAMSKRYGLGEAELVTRMTKGRFRVKGNIDERTANTYARDLERIGARVTISEAKPTTGTTPVVDSDPPLGPAGPNRVQTPSSGVPRQPPRTPSAGVR